MTIRTPLARAIRLAIGGAAGLSAALAAPLAAAQDDQTVYVVGSRIGRSADFEGPSPVLTVDRAAIENSGYDNLQQLLEKLPVNGNGAFSTRGNNQDSSANGAASISLRGLGADATLVLVNGRRVAISSFAESITTNFVDINTIPVAAIERVEVLKDGASAVYGSDAVAGVINIVLRKDFDGFEVSAGYGDVTKGSAAEYTASAIWGTSGEDSNVTMIVDYYKNETLENTERGRIGSADNSAHGGADYRSSRGYPGRFFVDDGEGRQPEILIDPACPAGSIAGQTCLYDYGPWNLLIPESERTGLLLMGHKGLGGGVEVFTEIAVQHNRSIAQGAPTPLDETAGLTLDQSPERSVSRRQCGRHQPLPHGGCGRRASGASRPTTCAGCSACAARSPMIGTGRSRHSVRAANRPRPATATRAGCAPTSCSSRWISAPTTRSAACRTRRT